MSSNHPFRRISAAVMSVLVWGILVAGAAQAQVPPDDPNAPYVTQPPVIVTEPVSWTRYALIAFIACLVGVAATLAVQAVLRHGRRPSPLAHA
jgi:hypothetical protein